MDLNLNKLSLHDAKPSILQLHGTMGDPLSLDEKKLIQKHLNILSLVEQGEVVITDTTFHTYAINEALRRYGNSLFDNSKIGENVRKYANSFLNQLWRENWQSKHSVIGRSMRLQPFKYTNNWKFENKGRDLRTFVINDEEYNTLDIFKSNNFTLIELAQWASALGDDGQISARVESGTPRKLNIIIISCMRDSRINLGRKSKARPNIKHKAGKKTKRKSLKLNFNTIRNNVKPKKPSLGERLKRRKNKR